MENTLVMVDLIDLVVIRLPGKYTSQKYSFEKYPFEKYTRNVLPKSEI